MGDSDGLSLYLCIWGPTLMQLPQIDEHLIDGSDCRCTQLYMDVFCSDVSQTLALASERQDSYCSKLEIKDQL